jgi:hypothetical protein
MKKHEISTGLLIAGLFATFADVNGIRVFLAALIGLILGGCGYQVQDEAVLACNKTLIVGVRANDNIQMVVDETAYVTVKNTDDDDMVRRLRARSVCVPQGAVVWFEIRPAHAEYGCDPDIAILVARENGAYKRALTWSSPKLDGRELVCTLRFSQ